MVYRLPGAFLAGRGAAPAPAPRRGWKSAREPAGRVIRLSRADHRGAHPMPTRQQRRAHPAAANSVAAATDPAVAAAAVDAAGLRYVSAARPGLTRRRAGRGFS